VGCGAGYSAEVCVAVFWCEWNCDNIQMMHGSEWTLKYDEPEVENIARGRSPSATFSTATATTTTSTTIRVTNSKTTTSSSSSNFL